MRTTFAEYTGNPIQRFISITNYATPLKQIRELGNEVLPKLRTQMSTIDIMNCKKRQGGAEVDDKDQAYIQ